MPKQRKYKPLICSKCGKETGLTSHARHLAKCFPERWKEFEHFLK